MFNLLSLKNALSFLLLLTLPALAGGAGGAGNAGSRVIYGTDNRADAPLHRNAQLRALAPSVAARIPKDELPLNARNQYQLSNSTLHNSQDVCVSERYAVQRVAAECSGFLVGPDTLVTAGHCMEDQIDCDNNYWAFDFLYSTRTLSEDQVFACSRIIRRELSGSNDYAVIQLDRVALGRRPLARRTSGAPAANDNLTVIGHPSGLPLKIADGGVLRNPNPSKNFFVADLDTYGGNSGSPVFNTQTLLVEGILVRGETDYVFDAQKACFRSKVCAMGSCRGEDVQKITAVPL